MKAYKGMNSDMTCRGFQYEVGKEYETEKAEVCKCGFHACEYPLDVFNYYSPAGNRFFEVEQSGDIEKSKDDSKVSSTKIKIGAEVNIAGLVKAAIEYTNERCMKEKREHATGYRGAASATGDRGAASATGYRGAASATGDIGAASATGDMGAASATGDIGAASATGKSSVAMASGVNGKAKGKIGCAIFLAERDVDSGKILFVNSAIVDGKIIKENVWYTLKNGEFVEVNNDNQ